MLKIERSTWFSSSELEAKSLTPKAVKAGGTPGWFGIWYLATEAPDMKVKRVPSSSGVEA